MKIRTGFISNSSSSSFLIATKTKDNHGNGPVFDALLQKLGVSRDSPFHYFLTQTLGRIWDDGREFTSWKDFFEDRHNYYYSDVSEDEMARVEIFDDKPINVKKLLEDGWIVRMGEIDSCEHLSDFHNISVDYEDDKLIFKHRGGH